MEKRKNRTMVKRKPFQGVLNILSFNRHFYVLGAIIFLGLIALWAFQIISGLTLLLALVGLIYGLVAPLVVSAYVYDFSGYYDLKWLDNLEETKGSKLVNIHAGFDETSFLLQEKFNGAELEAFDFYNSDRHTEKAIIRARKVTLEFPNTKEISTHHIPLENESIEIIFLLSAAHEIRNSEERDSFFLECKRVLKTGGKIIVLEHLRDLPNFLAFTIGFTHFHSHRSWMSNFRNAGFDRIKHEKFTPFLNIYTLQK